MESRETTQVREAEFWDSVASKNDLSDDDLRVKPDDSHDPIMPWLAELGIRDFMTALRDHLQIRPGMRVLDIGCGQGFLSAYLAHRGAEVLGCDISPRSIKTCERRAAVSGLSDRCTFKVMDCEALEVASESLDAVTGCFVLHHLDLPKVARELTRVLKPGARSAFIETMGYNGALMAARALLPGKFGIEKASSDDEYPLTRQRVGTLRENFDGEVGVQFPQVVFMRMGGYLPFLRGDLAKAGLAAMDNTLALMPGGGSLGYYGLVTLDRRGVSA